ncbi:MAG: hypothetical protein LBN23_07540 [Paludibacter sp.]|jgi:hypothetical protein|nr:hypothetical protein [Paludibacter sp.]
MQVLEITSRQFRANQKSYFDLADRGSQILIRRRQKPSYLLTIVKDNDLVFTQDALARIDKARQDALSGNVTVCRTIEESIKHLDLL